MARLSGAALNSFSTSMGLRAIEEYQAGEAPERNWTICARLCAESQLIISRAGSAFCARLIAPSLASFHCA
jgi:hypothetical protein